MNGHVSQCHSESTDAKQFSVTLEKLKHYVFKQFTNPNDIGDIFKEFKTPAVPMSVKYIPPSDKADAVATEDHDIDLSILQKT